MRLTDYRVLLLDCDGVLIDRDSGVWTALQGLLVGTGVVAEKGPVLDRFEQGLHGLYPRFEELGFTGLLCFAHRQLAEALQVRASWEESLSFARTPVTWPLFEDAPGALLYLRKFYRLVILCDRDAQDREALCERLGILAEELVAPAQGQAWLDQQQVPFEQALWVRASLPEPAVQGAMCLLRRGRRQAGQCPVDECINSLADLVAQHQLWLRR
ncbi:2-haloalkanoic acid dehalogenase [Pseudomonas silvicola]|nr:2-haloalkanoic acid dehalogenase [Pseudomonas silvicola]